MKRDVLFFIPGLSVGGAEQHTVGLRVQLEERGLATGLLVHGPRRAPAIVNHPGAADARAVDSRGMSDLKGWVRLWRKLREQPAAVIVAINQTPLIAAIVMRLLGATRAKIVCVFHTTILRPSEHRFFFLFRWALKRADALVFVSANQKAYWLARGITCARMPVVLNGVDSERFAPPTREARAAARGRWGFAEHELVIGLVATFRVEKNHAALVNALSLLRARGVAARVLFVGDGPTRPAVEKQVDEAGLRDRVVFAGEQTDVRPLLAACDVGVLPSLAVETFSLSALEFLAMGVPMVMSDIGGASEIVQPGRNGLLFEAGDDAALAACLERLADPDTRATLAAAAAPSTAALSVATMVDAYVAVIENVAGR